MVVCQSGYRKIQYIEPSVAVDCCQDEMRNPGPPIDKTLNVSNIVIDKRTTVMMH